MKKTKILFLLLIIIPLNTLVAQNSSDYSVERQEIMQLEEEYMANYINKNIKMLENYWDKKFIGWPAWSTVPLDVNEAKTALNDRQNNITSFKIHPQDFVIHNNTAIAYYSVDLYLTNEKNDKSKSTFRVIHTWTKVEDQWKILGGMSAN